MAQLNPAILSASTYFPAPRVVLLTDGNQQIGETCFSIESAKQQLEKMLFDSAYQKKFNLSQGTVEARLDYIRNAANGVGLPYEAASNDYVRRIIPGKLWLISNHPDVSINHFVMLDKPDSKHLCTISIAKHGIEPPHIHFFGEHLPSGIGQLCIQSTLMAHFLACCGAKVKACEALRVESSVLVHLGYMLALIRGGNQKSLPPIHPNDGRILELTSRRFGVDMATLFAEFEPPLG